MEPLVWTVTFRQPLWATEFSYTDISCRPMGLIGMIGTFFRGSSLRSEPIAMIFRPAGLPEPVIVFIFHISPFHPSISRPINPSTPHRLYQLSNASDKAQRVKDHSDGGVAKRNPSFGRLPLDSPFGRQNLVAQTYPVALWGLLA